MQEETPNFWAHLRRVRFQRIGLPDLTSEPANATTEIETPFTTVPDFSARIPWDFSATAAFEFLRQLTIRCLSTELEPFVEVTATVNGVAR